MIVFNLSFFVSLKFGFHSFNCSLFYYESFFFKIASSLDFSIKSYPPYFNCFCSFFLNMFIFFSFFEIKEVEN
jgi:hypothetical protein